MGAGRMKGRRRSGGRGENGCAMIYSFTPVFCRDGDGWIKTGG